MSVRTDVINLQVNINGNNAQNNLNDLKKKAADIKFEMEGLKKNTAEYTAKATELKKVTTEMDALKKTIGITSLNQKELTQELTKLRALKGSALPFSAEYKEWAKQIKVVEDRLYDVKNGVQGFSSFFSKIKDEVKQFGVMAAGYLGFQFLSSQFTNIIQGAGKMSDQLADLQRVSGLTAAEAKALNSELSAMDTRTSTGGLREIAIIAGKLGVAKGDLAGFTQEVDKLVVALGDELGDAGTITDSLGKILNVFDGNVTGENISKLGNAFVELANSGVATGAFLADFDQRLSGIAKSAGIGLGELTGLGAGLEELGSRVESSSTAIQKVIAKIAGDIPQAAQVAGMAEEQFRKLFEIDPTEALLRYSEGLVKNKKNFSEVVGAFSEVDESGARTIETITKLGTSSDLMRTRVAQGAAAIERTTASNEAFALKNETLGASLEKLGKDFNRLITSEGVRDFLTGAVEGAIKFIQVLKQVPQFISDNATALKLLILGIALLNTSYLKSAASIALNTAAKIHNAVVTRANAVATAIAQVAQASYITVTALLTKQINLATAAQRLWNIAMSLGAGPLGIIISLVGVAAMAFNSMSKSAARAKLEQEALATLAERAASSYGDQVNKLELLKRVMTDSNSTLSEKKKAYAELIAIHPDFANTLSLDESGHLKGATAIDTYIAALKKKGEAQAAQELSNETYKKILQEENIVNELKKILPKGSIADPILKEHQATLDGLRAQKKIYDDRIVAEIRSSATAVTDATAGAAKEAIGLIKDLQDKIKALDDKRPGLISESEIKDNIAMRKKYQAELDRLEGRESKTKTKKDTEGDRLKKEAEAFNKELQKLRRDAERGRLTDDKREIAQVEEKFADLLNRAKKYWAANSAVGKEKAAEIIAIRNMELEDLFKKQFAKRSDNEYEESLQNLDAYFEKERNTTGLAYANGVISKEQYEAELTDIQVREAQNRLLVAQNYEGTSQKAAGDTAKFSDALEKLKTANVIAEAAKRKKAREEEELAGAKLKVLTSPKGSQAELDAKKALLEKQFELETQFMDKKSSLYLVKQEELNNALEELDNQYFQARVDKIFEGIAMFQSALDSLNTIISNKEDRELQREKKRNDEKKAGLKKQLDGKLISQQQYELQVQKLNEEQDRKEKEIKLKQAKRAKAMAIFDAVVNTAAAVVKALPNLILAGITAALGVLQVAAIASAPLPEMGRGGYLSRGPKHRDRDRGLHVVDPRTGKTEMLLEREEAVINARAMTSNTRMRVEGTASQIASAINSSFGGVSWNSGAVMHMQPRWQQRGAHASINPGVVRMMALGGVVGMTNAGEFEKAENNSASAELLTAQILEMRAMREDMANWQTNLKARVSIRDIDNTRKLYDQAKQASGLTG